MKKTILPVLAGDFVVVHTDDGRDLRCEVLNVSDTTSGIKIKVQSGPHLLFVVNPGQVTQILKKEKQ